MVREGALEGDVGRAASVHIRNLFAMSWSYRKSIRIGPFRVNLSKSGVGYSVGAGGFRSGVSSSGRRYTSVSIPGTGMRYYKSRKASGSGCLLVALLSSALTLCGICAMFGLL